MLSRHVPTFHAGSFLTSRFQFLLVVQIFKDAIELTSG